MAVGDNYEVNMHYHVHQRALVMNLWFQVTTDPSDPNRTANDLCTAVNNAGLAALLSPLQSNQAHWDMVRAYQRTSALGGEEGNPPGQSILDGPGSIVGEALPDSSPIVIGWQQNAESAKANGRAFLSGIAESSTDGNVLTDAFRTGPLATFESAWEATLTNITGSDGGTYRQVVMSKLAALAPFDSLVYGTALDVTGVLCNPILRVMRGRASRWEAPSIA